MPPAALPARRRTASFDESEVAGAVTIPCRRASWRGQDNEARAAPLEAVRLLVLTSATRENQGLASPGLQRHNIAEFDRRRRCGDPIARGPRRLHDSLVDHTTFADAGAAPRRAVLDPLSIHSLNSSRPSCCAETHRASGRWATPCCSWGAGSAASEGRPRWRIAFRGEVARRRVLERRTSIFRRPRRTLKSG